MTVKGTRQIGQESAEAQLEALYRLDAVRATLDALLIGRWELDPDLVEALGLLLGAARDWARRAEAA